VASSTFRNRIIGTLIVIAVAVIFLPDFFNRAVERHDQEFRSTPMRPSVEQSMNSPSFPNDFTVDEAAQSDSVAVPIVEEQMTFRDLPESIDLGNRTEPNANELNEEVAAETEGSEAAEETVTNMDDAWVIQLGAFRNQTTVEELLEELSDAGYSAYSRVYQRDAGELHLVLVGPDLSKEKLEQQLAPLQALTRLEGKVLPYRPAEN